MSEKNNKIVTLDKYDLKELDKLEKLSFWEKNKNKEWENKLAYDELRKFYENERHQKTKKQTIPKRRKSRR